jgi:hypothetical protein
MDWDNIALSYILPSAWPMGQIIPKFLMEAPTAKEFFSNTLTFFPLIARALAVASPTIPAPMTIAFDFISIV